MNYKLLFVACFLLTSCNGYITTTNMMIKTPSKVHSQINRKVFFNVIGASFLNIKKSNAITKCDINLEIEHNKNRALKTELANEELYWLLNNIFLIFTMFNIMSNNR